MDAPRFQRRKGEFAAATVEAICREGFCPEKFDPIPIILDAGRWIVAGDGHSRIEALRQLRAAGQPIPELIPVRAVDESAALRLADTANASRTPFAAVEEARIIHRRQQAGETWQAIAASMHRSPASAEALSYLCRLATSIQDAVGTTYGPTLNQAIRFGRAADRFGWTHAVQHQVWLALKDSDLTERTFTMALEVIGNRLADTPPAKAGMLFEVPASVRTAIAELDQLYRKITRARSALRNLRKYADIFKDPQVVAALGEPMDRELAILERRLNTEAIALGDRRPVNKAIVTQQANRRGAA